MGKVMFSVCPHLGGGVPISHNALQHFPECHGAATGGGYPARGSHWGGYPARSSWGVPCQGVPCRGLPCWGGYPAMGSTLSGGYPARGVPCWGNTLLGGYPARGGTQVRYPPQQGQPGGGYPGQDNIGSTCYMTGGMPLAFTQEDFLVFFIVFELSS